MRVTVPTALLALLTLWLVGCSVVLNHVGRASSQQVDGANQRLDMLLQHLPAIPESTLLESMGGRGSGNDELCDIVYVHRLYGTNDFSLTEVMDVFTSSLTPLGWQPDVIANYGRTFKMSDESYLEVSDNYRFLPFSNSIIEQGKAKYKTLYLVLINTPVVPSYPRANCR